MRTGVSRSRGRKSASQQPIFTNLANAKKELIYGDRIKAMAKKRSNFQPVRRIKSG